jgi:poly(A) polymerase
MASPLFPVLLELYRCDESSSFKGLDGYYESSAVYQSYLRNRRNPYRSADGKKLNRGQIMGVTNVR